jgi:branched-chain amino acid transport system substrate-binding protein
MAPEMLAVGKKWYFLIASFTFGDDVLATYGDIVKAAGGTIVGTDRVPVETTDISSYILKVRQAKPGPARQRPRQCRTDPEAVEGIRYDRSDRRGGPSGERHRSVEVPREALTGIYGKTWISMIPTIAGGQGLRRGLSEGKRAAANRPCWAGWFMPVSDGSHRAGQVR